MQECNNDEIQNIAGDFEALYNYINLKNNTDKFAHSDACRMNALKKMIEIYEKLPNISKLPRRNDHISAIARAIYDEIVNHVGTKSDPVPEPVQQYATVIPEFNNAKEEEQQQKPNTRPKPNPNTTPKPNTTPNPNTTSKPNTTPKLNTTPNPNTTPKPTTALLVAKSAFLKNIQKVGLKRNAGKTLKNAISNVNQEKIQSALNTKKIPTLTPAGMAALARSKNPLPVKLTPPEAVAMALSKIVHEQKQNTPPKKERPVSGERGSGSNPATVQSGGTRKYRCRRPNVRKLTRRRRR